MLRKMQLLRYFYKVNLQKMEYDNDRKIDPPHKTEVFYWVVFAILSPMINAVTFFWYDALFWPALLISNLADYYPYTFYIRG